MKPRNYESIKKENFIKFSQSKFYLLTKYKGAFYPLKKLKQFIIICRKPYFNRLKYKILNRETKFIYEIETNKFFVCLLEYQNEKKFLSLKRLFLNNNFRNRQTDQEQKSFKQVLKYEKQSRN